LTPFLKSLPSGVSAGFYNLAMPAIDDDGRILVYALRNVPTSSGADVSELDRLLFTPDGVSSGSLAVPAPEPGTWAVIALAMLALAVNSQKHRGLCRTSD
jgi:hypothetical protein